MVRRGKRERVAPAQEAKEEGDREKISRYGSTGLKTPTIEKEKGKQVMRVITARVAPAHNTNRKRPVNTENLQRQEVGTNGALSFLTYKREISSPRNKNTRRKRTLLRVVNR